MIPPAEQGALESALRDGVLVSMDGDQWFARDSDFTNLMESPAGFGYTITEAVVALAAAREAGT